MSADDPDGPEDLVGLSGRSLELALVAWKCVSVVKVRKEQVIYHLISREPSSSSPMSQTPVNPEVYYPWIVMGQVRRWSCYD